jgi:hypothetical protein
MYKTIIGIHVWTSLIFIVIAVILCLRIITGLRYKRKYTKTDNRMEILFIALLYLGLFLGVILYFMLDPETKPKMLSLQEAQENAVQRFWAIEHFSIMLFALTLSQIGRIFTIKNITDNQKFRYGLFYYGLATLFTFISTGVYIFHKIS